MKDLITGTVRSINGGTAIISYDTGDGRTSYVAQATDFPAGTKAGDTVRFQLKTPGKPPNIAINVTIVS